MSELQILHAIQTLHNPLLDGIMVLVSSLGNMGMVWVAISLLLLFRKKTRECGVMMLFSMLLCLILGNGVLKNAIGRSRPCWIDSSVRLLIDMPKDYSFPSGHTMHGFTAALMIWFYNRRVGAAALILAGLIAFSRLYLFVHYPTDILAGFCIGTAMAMLLYRGRLLWCSRGV